MGFVLGLGRKKVALYIVHTRLLTVMKKIIISESERAWYFQTTPVGLSLSVLRIHALCKQAILCVQLDMPVSFFILYNLPVSLVRVYQFALACSDIMTNEPPSLPKLYLCPSVLLLLLEHSSGSIANCLFYIALSGTTLYGWD